MRESKFATNFRLHKLSHEKLKKPTADCPICERTNQRIVDGKCSHCYQSEYIKKRKEDRQQYSF